MKGYLVFDQIKLRTKLLGGNGIILMLLLIISIIVFVGVKSLLYNFNWIEHTRQVLHKASAIEAAAVDMETGMRGYMLAGKDEFLEPYNSGIKRFYTLIDELSATVSDNPAQVTLLSETKENLLEWQTNITETNIAFRKQVGNTKTMDNVAELVGQAKGKQYFDRFRQQITTFKEREEVLMVTRISSFKGTEKFLENVSVFGTLLAIVIGIMLAIFITHNIMRQLGGEPAYIEEIAKNVADGDLQIGEGVVSDRNAVGVFAELQNMIKNLRVKSDTLERIAGGDLTVQVVLSSDKDTLGRSLQKMVNDLNDLFGQVQVASDSIASGSSQLSEASKRVAEGSDEQASNLKNITASLLELTSQTNENTDNAMKARNLSSSAQQAAQTGGEEMGRMMKAMEEINDSSQNIEGFIKTINEIASQTNLLALNAAIEAARAGEEGRGFAVVADEVRSLAARSAKTAQETSALIIQSTEKTKNGIEIAGQTTSSLENIFSNVNEASNLATQIASDCSEQAQSVEYIAESVSGIDAVTQASNTDARDTAITSKELAVQAEILNTILKKFTLNKSAVS
jgi:methyl-accepting chemotaxis protein